MVAMAHRRRAKSSEYYRREQAERWERQRVLVVSEGKTELVYLRALMDHLGINQALIDMWEGDPHQPEGVLRSAERRLAAPPQVEYSKVFCVFDRDQHQSFWPTVQKIRSGTELLQAIPSVPCFEYWLLLHFEKTARSYPISKDVSSCREVEKDLRARMPEYSKGMVGAKNWRRVLSGLEAARKHSGEILRQAESDPDGNSPYTHMHELVDYLEALR